MGRKTRHNCLTSKETLALVDKQNMILKEDFLSYMRATKKSDGTIRQYNSDLNIFFVWLMEKAGNKLFQNVSKRDIINFQNWLIYDNGNSPARVRRIKASISSLSNFCENILSGDEPGFDNYRSIVRKIESPVLVPVREKTVWEDEELESLLDKLLDRKRYEQACFVALGMYGGRRASEILRFKVSDFDENKLTCNGALYKSDPILTKGNKYLECYTLSKKFKPFFDKWMDYRRVAGIESEWLFPSPSNCAEHRDTQSIGSWAESITRLAGKDYYAHSLRHYFVSALSRAGIPDNIVVQIIGWSSADMFNIYNDNSKDDQISMYFSDGDIAVPTRKGFSDL